MGAVFQAVNLENSKPIAIKVISPDLVTDDKFIKRFEREADLGKLLKHSNIVGVEEFGQTEDRMFFIAMEFVPGETLKTYLAKSGALTPNRSLELLTPLCEALDFAHNHNVLHRDLKPENILVAKGFNGKEILKLADFGIAKRTDLTKAKDQMLTIEGEIFGTPHYMSPEQVLAETLKPTTDVYSVGVMLYQMLSGKLPIEHPRAQQLLVMKVSQDIAPISKTHAFISPLFDPVFRKALTRLPSERYQSAGELLNDVKDVVVELTATIKTNEPVKNNSSMPISINKKSNDEVNIKPLEGQKLKTTSQKLSNPKLKTYPPNNSSPIKPSIKPVSNSTTNQNWIVAGVILAIVLVFLLATWVLFFR
ncbi:MAG: serine/threonine protein kinase [bacterium]|nr:MAG: serine/threonine protein kinase [bacterium]